MGPHGGAAWDRVGPRGAAWGRMGWGRMGPHGAARMGRMGINPQDPSCYNCNWLWLTTAVDHTGAGDGQQNAAGSGCM
jgi:hypothetical protein